MIWKLSCFRTGDLAEVRSKEEILATLDEHGCADGMPFMPEMLQYCGQRFRVSAVAHKTCDTVGKTGKNRRLHTTVHLAGLRCDGSVHGGCQAECTLFWKDAWLKPVLGQMSRAAKAPADATSFTTKGCTESQLVANANSRTDCEEPRYSCQATQMYEATEPLAPWNPRQYFYDVLTRNYTVRRVCRVLWLSWFRWLMKNAPRGYRIVKFLSDSMHRCFTDRPSPSLDGKIKPGCPTPTDRLDLKPGEYVRIKSKSEIEHTLDESGNNRGLSFDAEEMAPYCGRVFMVRRSVSKIIHEPTGKMIPMKQPCIMLEGVVCKGEYASCRLNCPRAIPAFWREIWLERVSNPLENRADEREDVGTCESATAAVTENGSPYKSGKALPILDREKTESEVVESGIVV